MALPTYTLKHFSGCKPDLFDEAIRIRTEVFVIEQEAPPETEPDKFDTPGCHHWLAYASNADHAVATGRMFADSNEKTLAHIGRMAVLKEHRGKGLGHLTLSAMLRLAPEVGFKSILLEAQSHAQPFYAKLGFSAEGEEFMLDNIPHIHMRLIVACENI
ncbi:MAG: GNAT family N-acetyltransferase [Vampirovibrionales bacterium]|nr:GNAT family N-acetyltransferase [Vampirovibrionales bacterium]